jgi:hypothetical protein
MLDTVSSTCSLNPNGDFHSVPSASVRATISSPRSATTSREMTSSEEPDSSGVCFLFLLRLGVLGFVPTCRGGSGDTKRGFLSTGWRKDCVGDEDLVLKIDFSIRKRRAKPE